MEIVSGRLLCHMLIKALKQLKQFDDRVVLACWERRENTYGIFNIRGLDEDINFKTVANTETLRSLRVL